MCETGTPNPALELHTPEPARLETLPGNEETLDKTQDIHATVQTLATVPFTLTL